MKNNFNVVEKIYLNNELKEELTSCFKDYQKSYEYITLKIFRYLEDILQTKEIDSFNLNGNGINFVITDSYYVDDELMKETIEFNINELSNE